MFDFMLTIWRKNAKTYKRDFLNTLTMWLRPIILIIPLIFFSKYVSSDIKVTNFLVISGLLAYLIGNTVIGTNFELSNELKSGTHINFLVAPVSYYAYILAQALFQAFLITVEVIILAGLFYKGELSFKNLIIVSVSTICLILISISFAIILSIITVISGTFRYSSMLTNLVLLLSGIFFPITVFPEFLRMLSLVNPFTYGIDIVRSLFIGSNTIFDTKLELAIIFMCTVLGVIVSEKIIKYYIFLIKS
ncbi:ABC transporter permease [Paraclostridium dentum]|uniref:ABC transporter permease n=1 Tax=Paraclostridium dentum TaxID=2662455 RepID=UPI0034643BC7